VGALPVKAGEEGSDRNLEKVSTLKLLQYSLKTTGQSHLKLEHFFPKAVAKGSGIAFVFFAHFFFFRCVCY